MNALLIASFFGIVLMFCGVLLKNKLALQLIAVAGCIALVIGNVLSFNGVEMLHYNTSGMMSFNSINLTISTIIFVSVFFYLLLNLNDIAQVGNHFAEYLSLIFFVLAGIVLVISFDSLFIFFLGIEIVSIPLFILAGAEKKNLRSNEASLKYFLLGSFSTAILLMGIALLYGATATFDLSLIHLNISKFKFLILTGMLFILVAMAFKVSAAPFHFWTPDVYDGSPTVFTSLMATIVKIAFVVSFMRLFSAAFADIARYWQIFILLLIIATLIIGNITAVFQQSIKRMMAYSSIAQAGFLLFAVLAINQSAYEGVIIYSAAYCLATIGIFSFISKISDYTNDGINGLANSQPWVASLVTICLLSLAGIPLTSGFLAKLFMLKSILHFSFGIWFVIFAVIFSAISLIYYFRVIQAMYFKTANERGNFSFSLFYKIIFSVVAFLIILLGIFPSLIIQFFYF